MKVGKSRGLDKIILWYGRKSMEEKKSGKDSMSIVENFFMIVDICVLMKNQYMQFIMLGIFHG